MLDDYFFVFCFLKSLIFGAKDWNGYPKGAMDFCGLVVELHMHTIMCMLCMLVVVH